MECLDNPKALPILPFSGFSHSSCIVPTLHVPLLFYSCWPSSRSVLALRLNILYTVDVGLILLPVGIAIQQYADYTQAFAQGSVDAVLSLVENILDPSSAIGLWLFSNRLR